MTITMVRRLIESERDFNLTNEINNDDSLIEHGVLDSFDLITLLVILENAFDIKLDQEDMDRDNFYSIKTIADFINKKKSYKSP